MRTGGWNGLLAVHQPRESNYEEEAYQRCLRQLETMDKPSRAAAAD